VCEPGPEGALFLQRRRRGLFPRLRRGDRLVALLVVEGIAPGAVQLHPRRARWLGRCRLGSRRGQRSRGPGISAPEPRGRLRRATGISERARGWGRGEPWRSPARSERLPAISGLLESHPHRPPEREGGVVMAVLGAKLTADLEQLASAGRAQSGIPAAGGLFGIERKGRPVLEAGGRRAE